jgi:hypothetical protein
LIELSNIGEKDMILKRLQEAKAPPPELVAMQAQMAKLEAALNAIKVDQGVADVAVKNAQTLKTLGEAAALGVEPNAIHALFPLQYRQPTNLESLQSIGQPGQQQPMASAGAMIEPQGPEQASESPRSGNPERLASPAQ